MVLGHDVRYIDGEPMTLITFDGGKVVLRDGKVGTEQACCCSAVCGDNCLDTVTVDVSVAGYAVTLTFSVADGSDTHSEFVGLFDYFLVSAFITCALVDGAPLWTLVVSVCWQNGNDFGSEDWEGEVLADGSGCPETGSVAMGVTFGNGDATVTASIA